MKAAYIKQTGPPETIQVGELPTPKPHDAQALVRVEAVDVNPIDTYVRGGLVAAPLPIPFIIGCDLAGVVEAVGPGAKRFKPGDRVWCSNQGRAGRQGTFSEYAVIDEEWLNPIPAGVTSEAAVAMSLVGLTAYLGIARAQLKSGETLFVNGGSGGVGSAVVQMGKAMGARVITTAGSSEKVTLARELGADLAINYKQEDVAARVKEFAPQGVNVWYETLREQDFDLTVSLLATFGRMVVMAGRDARPPMPVGPFYVKSCSLFGFALFNVGATEQRTGAEDINRWMAAGKLKANIDRVIPLDDVVTAHRLQEESTIGGKGTLTGKIVLKL